MAAGARNKQGKATDIVRHFVDPNKEVTACNRKNWLDASIEWEYVTCKTCLKQFWKKVI